jgi:hypothetical protein
MSARLYVDGAMYVIVLTGHPTDAVRIGTGDTVAEAWETLETTGVQCVGTDGGVAGALRWAHYAGWISAPDSLVCRGEVSR